MSTALARLAPHLPPLRYWVGCVTMALEVALLEKAASISGGGVSGLAIAIAHWLPWPVGAIILIIKLSLLGLAFWHGGGKLTAWTGVAVLVSAGCTWLFELVRLPFQWPPLVAFVLVLLVSYGPPTLIMHGGYSGGGYATLAQVLFERRRVPVGLTFLLCNAITLTALYLAFGAVSSALSMVATLLSGPLSQAWWWLWCRWLGEPATR